MTPSVGAARRCSRPGRLELAPTAARRGRGLVGAPDRHAHALVLDLDLPHARLLDDLHELADALAALGVGVLGDEHRVARVAAADDLSSASASEPNIAMRTSSSSLAARPSACSRTSSVVTGSSVELHARREELDRALDGRVDRLGRHAVAALHELAELVDDRAVAPRLEHVQERLRREDLADRSRERRPAGLGPNAPHLLEHLEQPIRGDMRAQMHLERGDEPGGKVVLGGANGDPRRDLRHRLVADPLVDDVRGVPELRDVEPGPVAEAVERLRDRLARDAVERQRERVDGRRDEVGARVDGRECGCEADASGPLHVEADGKPARLLDPGDELLRLVREERAGRVVHDDPRRAEVGQLARLLDERVGLVGASRAVDEPAWNAPPALVIAAPASRRFETSFSGSWRRKTSMPFSAAHDDEAADDVAADRARADEEAAAQRDPERRRHAGLDRADPLPRALDAAAHRRVEDAAARDLEAREAGSVEDLRDAKHLGGRQLPREGLLREQADGRVDELRHGGDLSEVPAPASQAREM